MKKRTIRLSMFILSMAALLISGKPQFFADLVRLLLLLVLTLLAGWQLWREDKRFLTGTAVCMGGLFLAVGAIHWRRKAAYSVSIIGGADGPTSVFLAGKVPEQSGLYLLILGVLLLAAAVLLLWRIYRDRSGGSDSRS